MNLRINKHELQLLKLWGTIAESQAESVGVPFEEDEIKLLKKLEESL